MSLIQNNKEYTLKLRRNFISDDSKSSYKVDSINGRKIVGALPSNFKSIRSLFITNNHELDYSPSNLGSFIDHSFLEVKGSNVQYNVPVSEIDLSGIELKITLEKGSCFSNYSALVYGLDRKYNLSDYLEGTVYNSNLLENNCNTEFYEFIRLILYLISNDLNTNLDITTAIDEFTKSYPNSKLNHILNNQHKKIDTSKKIIKPNIFIINYNEDSRYDNDYWNFFPQHSNKCEILSKSKPKTIAEEKTYYDYIHISGHGDMGGFEYESRMIPLDKLLLSKNLKNNFDMISILYCNYQRSPKTSFPNISHSTHTTNFFDDHISFLYSYGFVKCYSITNDHDLSDNLGKIFTFSFSKANYRSLQFSSH